MAGNWLSGKSAPGCPVEWHAVWQLLHWPGSAQIVEVLVAFAKSIREIAAETRALGCPRAISYFTRVTLTIDLAEAAGNSGSLSVAGFPSVVIAPMANSEPAPCIALPKN